MTWLALGRIRSVWRPTAALEATLRLMAGSVIALLLGLSAVLHIQRGVVVCVYFDGNECLRPERIAGSDEATLEATAAALTMWFAVVDCRTSRRKSVTA